MGDPYSFIRCKFEDGCCAAKRGNPKGGQADTSKLENEIDELVAARQLYRLTQDEIDIVEGKE